MIELSGVTKRFGSKCVVDRLDLEVRPGELFAFLGPNGRGQDNDDQDDLRAARTQFGDGAGGGV